MLDIYDKNFWEVHAEIKYVPNLNDFYSKDKSEDKLESSKIMWAIEMCENPESKFYRRPDKYNEMSKTFLKDIKNFKWDKYQHVVESYRDSVLTDAQRALTSWNETIRMRDKTIKTLYQELLTVDAVDLDTKALRDIDAMLAATPKMFDDYNKIMATYEEEKIKKKGSSIPSMSDADDI
jgi:hypothetical protein